VLEVLEVPEVLVLEVPEVLVLEVLEVPEVLACWQCSARSAWCRQCSLSPNPGDRSRGTSTLGTVSAAPSARPAP